MSFILDALRKSESERQQDSRPNIARVPDAVPVRGLPGWAVGTMSVLAAGIVALGVLWWHSMRDVTDVSSPVPAASSNTTPLPIPPADTAGQAPRPAAGSQPGTASAPARLARTTLRDAVAAERPTESGGSRAGGAPPSGSAAETNRAAGISGRGPARSGAPSLDPQPARYVAGQGNLPALRLELHAYDPSPTGRFVFINGTKYVEGDRLAEGPELIAVTAEGAVLLAGGQQLLLRQE